MPINRTPSSSFGFLVKSKTFVVACLLSSAAMITEPQVAQARGGMNGFMAGAILGGAMRGLAPPGGRAYRGGRSYRGSSTYRGSRSGSRYGRSRGKPEKEIEAKDSGGEKVFGTSTVPAAAAGAAATGAAVTGASAASSSESASSGGNNSGSGSTAAASTGSNTGSETGGSSGRSSSRGGRSGGLQTIKDGLD